MEHDYLTLKKALDNYKIFNIPYYQRDYVWGIKNNGQNLHKLMDDIFTQYKNNPNSEYLIGTLAFCYIKNKDIKNRTDIIDGQQRLTSLILILSILAKKCSKQIKDQHKKLLEFENSFIIQEPYLTKELKYVLEFPNHNYNGQESVNLSITIKDINNWFKEDWEKNENNKEYSKKWYDDLYNYILNNVTFICFEFDNISDSLKYFLNINSLSISLDQLDIFYSILSESLRLSNSVENIFSIKDKLNELKSKTGIKQPFKEYKKYDEDEKDKIGITNIIYIFLKTYYQKDRYINDLNIVGIGKWISLYKNDIFNNSIKAKEFVDNFIQYINDFKALYMYFTDHGNLDINSSLYILSILLNNDKEYILKVLFEVFKLKYSNLNKNLYSTSNLFNINELNEIAKRLTLTYLKNCNTNKNNKIINFSENIEINKKTGTYNKSIQDLLSDLLKVDFTILTYQKDAKSPSGKAIRDQKNELKIIFSCQEAFLNNIADPSYSFGQYLGLLLDASNFTIEHFYSKSEWEDINRRTNWQSKMKMFNQLDDFELKRFKFENLSLLSSSINSSANDMKMKDKLDKYKNAKGIYGKPEYLIQSLVENSDYYKNINIQSLGLPDRHIEIIDDNIWKLSLHNDEFNKKLLELAFKKIANI